MPPEFREEPGFLFRKYSQSSTLLRPEVMISPEHLFRHLPLSTLSPYGLTVETRSRPHQDVTTLFPSVEADADCSPLQPFRDVCVRLPVSRASSYSVFARRVKAGLVSF